MIIIPVQTANHDADLLILVMDPEVLAYVKAAHPWMVEIREMGCELHNPNVLVCYEPMSDYLRKILKDEDMTKLLKFLTRGSTTWTSPN